MLRDSENYIIEKLNKNFETQSNNIKLKVIIYQPTNPI